MMPDNLGLILIISQARNDIFEDWVRENAFFAEAVPDFPYRGGKPVLVIISAKAGSVTHLAVGQRGLRAGIGQRRLNLRPIHELAAPLSIQAILRAVPNKFRQHIRPKLRSGGLLAAGGLEALVVVLRERLPECHQLLSHFDVKRQRRIRELPSRTRDALASQKEALNSALHIAGLDRSSLLAWTPTATSSPQSFIQGLPEARVIEDNMIFHDQVKGFPGFASVRRSITGVARFENKEIELEVILANRTPLERQTGTDLIYYNATYPSFVFVQYKVMERDDAAKEATFRLPNSKLTDQLARVDKLLAKIEFNMPIAHRHEFRLCEQPYYLKLCSRLVFDPDDVDLTPGMYFPLRYWRAVESDQDLLGKKGGRVISYANIGRHLNNTEFVTLVRSAWVGTTPKQSALLSPLISALLHQGRATVIAVARIKKKKSQNMSGADIDSD